MWLLFMMAVTCGTPEHQPAQIHPEDICAYCSMAISDARFAAQLLTVDKKNEKFDDIGCLLAYMNQNISGQPPLKVYCADYRTKEWIDGHKAFFVISSDVHTPMASGIVSFVKFAAAQDFAGTMESSVIPYAELVRKGRLIP